MLTKVAEVAQFLRAFHQKMSIWGVIYRDDRGKNGRTLLALEMRPDQRTMLVKSLKVEDYSEGPRKDTLNGGPDMWVFGKRYKGTEIYIKVTMGLPGKTTICISFHIAESPMLYPLK
ncbi:hypothetical protein SAMN04488128_101553 [Chitinophaga eiseniae]|uniref:Motility quorum-sensing regulator, toxin of MqsA n=1 Tax=Chitinophaga eiseniae TaxID=634771 RepID=A0A1T4LA10_9BACT|nr:toxin [Chitinophaga eiseniae]SJZ51579.1 hypothetical protein SAMN04488128_101553 [Chitinophaga eiseniae]